MFACKSYIIICIFSIALFTAPSCNEGEDEEYRMEQFKLEAVGAADEAEIFVHYPLAGKQEPSPAVLICPGGGYSQLFMDSEGHKIAKWFASQGFVGVVLKYRFPEGRHTAPLSDAEQAMSTIRRNAALWHIDSGRVGVLGASAGGHLAACLSNLAADANRPDFAILFYPVISFDNSITHYATREALLGNEVANSDLIERYSLEKQVNAKTPPTLLLVCKDDEVVNSQNSILYYSVLQQQHIPSEIRIFPNGGHGWGFDEGFSYHQEVKSLIRDWLKMM
ncbi:MAG: alpha/beta hydrolase [Tannerellaceae bacterium]|nr:alpha/beta hydrolase [Tannerellaceae bacterium]